VLGLLFHDGGLHAPQTAKSFWTAGKNLKRDVPS
jgi:hypothetical protein